jgi:hypothetical protein
MQEALTCARGISDDWEKSSALKDISTELAKQDKVEQALTCAKSISDESEKSSALKDIASELAKQDKVEEALTCARSISSDAAKSRALAAIATELAKQDKVEEALTCARGISSDRAKSSALAAISTELAKQGNWALTETTGLEIPQVAERHRCWKTMAKDSCNENGWQKALEQVNQFTSDEARLFYLKGWAEAVNQQDANNACVQEALSHLVHDSESIENLLQKHALQELFFDTSNKELVNRLNKTLNLQWAIDIKNQLPN